MKYKTDGMMESYEALVKQAKGETDMPYDDRSSRRNPNGNFFGRVSWEKAVDMAEHGDIKGAAALRPAIIAGATKMRMELGRLDPVYRLDEGQWIDVARYVKGEPECWGAMVDSQERTARRSVSVVLNTCVPAGITAAEMDSVAVALGSAVLGLQSSGYMVSLYLAVVNAGNGRAEPWIVGAPINRNGAALDIARLSAVLRPWFFRRIIFSVWETATADQRKAWRITSGGGYGYVGHLTAADALRITGDKNAIRLDVDRYIHNVDGIKHALMEAMGAKGGK